MKSYLKQIYSEGFATVFYLKPIRFLEKRIRNKKLLQLISVIFKCMYTLLLFLFAGLYVYLKLIRE